MDNKIIVFIALFALTACGGNENNNTTSEDSTFVETMSFEQLSPEESGIDFYNTITENDSFNFYSYEYIYNGAGVAVGDINNDGLSDVYFTGNQVEDKLYLNKGNMQFEDITASAFEPDYNEGWHTGVVMADVNGDDWIDIYVCRSGDPSDRSLLQNLLFINNGDMTFTEKGEEFGVNVEKRTTHALFLDYDNDNDLDLYVLNHPPKYPEDLLLTLADYKKIKMYGKEADVFLENQDGKFVDVTEKAGILNNCYGLGVAAGDLDGNGYVDIYVSNDYQDPDLLYMNNGDGTFSQDIKTRTNHISAYSMGNDIADFNNDGYLDIFTVDMAAEDHVRSKRNMGAMSTEEFWNNVSYGLHYQYMFNGLQMNNGDGTFTEIAQVAGVSKSDWSWAPLFADFDNDGHKDLFISNGYNREARDNDYLRNYSKKKHFEGDVDFEEGLELMPTAKIHNYIYKNEGDVHFTKKTDSWELDIPVNTNGAAYADLDNDGDLDLILNNMEENSFILENKLQSKNNYVRLQVKGGGKNTAALGAKVKVTTGDNVQYSEIQYSRGYESSVEPVLHFGIRDAQKVDKIEIVWPNGQRMIKEDIAANQLHAFDMSQANGTFKPDLSTDHYLVENIKDSIFSHVHQEALVNDFASEVLMPHKMSQLGPFMSKGDVNGDQLEDIYVSGAADFSGTLYIQTPTGFEKKEGPWSKEKTREELGSELFDADGDGDLDLYVVSGGNEFVYNSPLMQDQLYINDGNGNFTNETKERLPKMEASGQRLAISDYDKDGDLDLYVGGRQMPGYYPFTSRSFLLQNDGKGNFKDITLESVGETKVDNPTPFEAPGMVTDCLFDDFDQDGDDDLVIIGEWMPIMFYENNDGKFSDVSSKYNPGLDVGWWYSIEKGDFNGDGINEYIVGNVGANNKFHPSKEKPLELYCDDFDNNGTFDIVLAKYQNDICYPVRGRQCSSEQMPFIKQKFPTYAQYATADVESIYGPEKLQKALHYSANNFHSVLLTKTGGNYKYTELPVFAQLGPINKTIVHDINNDGNLDAIVVGNNFAVEVETIRYDGGRGAILMGDGQGNFRQLGPMESGFYEPNDCKDMALIDFGGQPVIITVSNRNMSKTFAIKS
ncbi:MAG: VCBS repeat-containing protein [Crocinitomicaceae bacterium]